MFWNTRPTRKKARKRNGVHLKKTSLEFFFNAQLFMLYLSLDLSFWEIILAKIIWLFFLSYWLCGLNCKILDFIMQKKEEKNLKEQWDEVRKKHDTIFPTIFLPLVLYFFSPHSISEKVFFSSLCIILFPIPIKLYLWWLSWAIYDRKLTPKVPTLSSVFILQKWT